MLTTYSPELLQMVANRVKSVKVSLLIVKCKLAHRNQDPRPVESPIAPPRKELTVDTQATEIKVRALFCFHEQIL